MGDQLVSFANQFFDPSFYSSDLTFMLCTVVLLGRFHKRPLTIAKRCGDLLGLLVIEALISLAFFLLPFGPPPFLASGMCLALYAASRRRMRTTDKVVRCTTFFASHVLLTGMMGIFAPALSALGAVLHVTYLPNLLSLAGLLGVTLFLRRYSISGFRYVPSSYAYLLAGVSVIASVAAWAFIRFSSVHQVADMAYVNTETTQVVLDATIVNLVVDMGFFALLLISYRMFYLLSSEHDHRAERIITARAATANSDMMEVTRDAYESMRDMRHEMRNRMAYMSSLADSKEWEKLARYLSSLGDRSSGFLNYVQSGNSTVDAIVNAKMSLARSKGVDVKTMLAVPRELSIPDEDLFTLIANLMDNAIEGALASQVADRTIKLSIRPEGSYYVLTVQNPCLPQKDAEGSLARLKTTKDDAEAHGYGTRLVSRIARANKGTARYAVKDNVFVAMVMFAQAKYDKGE